MTDTTDTTDTTDKETPLAFEDFKRVDMRVGTVRACEPVPKSDKLLKFVLEVGEDTLTILSGIAANYAPEKLVGRQVVFVKNLAPRKMMGMLSEGMILTAVDAEGKLALLGPDDPLASGAKVE